MFGTCGTGEREQKLRQIMEVQPNRRRVGRQIMEVQPNRRRVGGKPRKTFMGGIEEIERKVG